MTIAERPAFSDRIRAAVLTAEGRNHLRAAMGTPVTGRLTKASLTSQAISTTGLAELARELAADNQMIPFGPGIPIAPTFAEEDEPRRTDYPVSFNVPTQPRSFEPITFRDLRQLATNYDIAQLAIQKRIDGLRRLNWAIRPKPISGQTRKEGLARAGRLEGAIAETTGFFTMPDQEHDFADWLALYVYDVFSIDAATIFRRPTLGGELYGLDIIDGATIRPIIDGYGRPPAPPMPAFAQVIKGMTRELLTRDQLIYSPFWARRDSFVGHPPLEWVLMAVNRALRRQTLDLSNFTEGTLPVAFLKLAAETPMTQVKELKAYLDELLAGNDVARSRVIPIPGGTGTGLDRVNGEPTTDGEEWLMHITCAAIGVSPIELGFVAHGAGLGGKGIADTQHDAGIARDIGLAEHIKGKLDRVIASDPPYGLGQPELEFFWEDLEKKEDRLAEAQALDLYVSMGATTPDWIAENILDQDPQGVGAILRYSGNAVPLKEFLAPPEPVPAALGPGGPPPETPNAAPGETTDEQSVGEPVTKAAAADLDLARWQRKALRAVREGRGPARFDSVAIAPAQVAFLRDALAKVSGAEDVRAAFSLAKSSATMTKREATSSMKRLYADWFREQGNDIAQRVAAAASGSL